MQHNHDLALLDARGRMAVLGANRAAAASRYDPETSELTRDLGSDGNLDADCAAFFQPADELYYAERLRPGLPAAAPVSSRAASPARPPRLSREARRLVDAGHR